MSVDDAQRGLQRFATRVAKYVRPRKVPYKGTSKEYIGDDVLEIRDAVDPAQHSTMQPLLLRHHVFTARSNALPAARSR